MVQLVHKDRKALPFKVHKEIKVRPVLHLL
jgi:hypothetical protein